VGKVQPANTHNSSPALPAVNKETIFPLSA
jgi:hypothetical protein